MQLHPRETFTITHQLNNPAYITDTAYVRAVIRNAKTDATLATKDLTDKGSGRFTVEYLVPADVSGQGFWISIVTTVYSDSGYTTQSQNYGVEANTYLVQERVNTNLGIGGGGSDISYKKIREIVKEEIDKINIPEPIPFPKIKDVDVIGPISVLKKEIDKKIDSIIFPEFPSFDSIIEKIDSVISLLNATSSKSDSSVSKAVQNILTNMKSDFINSNKINSDIMKESLDKMTDLMKSFELKVPEFELKLKDANYKIPEQGNVKSKIDPRITKLMQKNI